MAAEDKSLWYLLYSCSRNGYLIAAISNLVTVMKEAGPCEIVNEYSSYQEALEAAKKLSTPEGSPDQPITHN